MRTVGATSFPVAVMRSAIVMPGACVEGALAVALPWTLAQALRGSAWLGAASAGLVLAAMLGTLVAPALERQVGNRRMTVLLAFASMVALAAAALCWVSGLAPPAYFFVLLAIAADAACDLGFASRMPLLARLSAQRLEQFSGSNWLWGIVGAATGSVLAGWAVAADRVLALALGSVWLSFVVAVALAVVMPRESRRRTNQPPMMRALIDRSFWTARAVKVALVLVVLVFFSGPLDNLLLPAHLSSRSLPASTFGNMLAALGLGLAAGLWWMQSSDAATEGRKKLAVGLLGIAGQLGLMLCLPPQWLLLSGLFVSAALFAPLLPMLEAAMLTAARPSQRTLMLAAMSTLIGVADVLGTLSIGLLMSWSSSTLALSVCLGVACLAVVVCGLWPSRQRV